MSDSLRRLRGFGGGGLRLLRHGRPRRVLLFGPLSLGDDLLCTTVLREARVRRRPFAMMTNRPEFFRDNPDPAAVIPIHDYYAALLRRLGARVVQPYYTTGDPERPEHEIFPSRHILAEMCRLAGLQGPVTLRPYLFLTPEEKARGARCPRQIAIHSTCLTAAVPYPTKEWGVARLAAVAGDLGRDFNLVQLGGANDPALPVTLDLRGRTNLREAAAVLAASEIFVGLEGFLAHLARAVDCPSVVILGGRAPPPTVGYACNVNLHRAIECAPCGLRDGCPYRLKCLTEILPATVAAAARELIGRRLPRPLPAETAVLP
ncbi:MAG TPA: glycosyltransferase family 9 protein [Opitutaceae bacterium]|nr:glycosyltransferase family 9 protein [Opitutaceae bacterium]